MKGFTTAKPGAMLKGATTVLANRPAQKRQLSYSKNYRFEK